MCHKIDYINRTLLDIVHFRTVRESWIRAKYIQKAFVRRLPLGEDGAAQSGSTEGNKTFSQQ